MVSKTKLLLVDDNQEFLEILIEFFEDNNYDVASCSNGREAQVKFIEFLPDIIITDIVMPEVDGIELLLALRKINPKAKVIVMSGGNKGYAESYLIMADKLGADSIINKPFKLHFLFDEVKKLECVKS